VAVERKSANISRLGERRAIPRESVKGLVSVIIPSYQSRWCVAEAVDCALDQTYKPIEVVVVDDGSTDCTAELLYSRFGNSIKMVSQPNQGLAGARNTGLENSSGEYIQFLDADDLMAPDKIAKQVSFLEQHPEVSVVGSFYREISMDEAEESPEIRETMKRTGVRDFLVQNCLGPVHCALTRRSAMSDIGGFDDGFKNYCADWEFWMTMAARGFQFGCVEEPLVVYRRHGKSLTKEDKIPNLIGDLKVVQRGLEYARQVRKIREWDVYGAMSLRFRNLTKGYASSGKSALALKSFFAGCFYGFRAGRMDEILSSVKAFIK